MISEDKIIQTIKAKGTLYGDSFIRTRKLWEEYFSNDLEATTYLHPESVVKMMALLKQAREETLLKKIEECANKELLDALQDTRLDKTVYKWIADNWNTYLKIMEEVQ
jgi:uncharacterized Fe-S cluster-containing radical SAM superfamily protein